MGAHRGPVCEDQLGANDAVTGEAVLAHGHAQPTSQSQPLHSLDQIGSSLASAASSQSAVICRLGKRQRLQACRIGQVEIKAVSPGSWTELLGRAWSGEGRARRHDSWLRPHQACLIGIAPGQAQAPLCCGMQHVPPSCPSCIWSDSHLHISVHSKHQAGSALRVEWNALAACRGLVSTLRSWLQLNVIAAGSPCAYRTWASGSTDTPRKLLRSSVKSPAALAFTYVRMTG